MGSGKAMHKRIFNRTDAKEKRRVLRNNAPVSEATLWARLRREQIAGFRFRRQYSVGAFVIDFFCAELKLAVEIDGASHNGEEAQEYDLNRQAWIEQYGIQFLRFTNEQVHHDIESVLQVIDTTTTKIRSTVNAHPASPSEKGRSLRRHS